MSSLRSRLRPDRPGRYRVTVRHEGGRTVHGGRPSYDLIVDAPTRRTAAESAEHRAEAAQGGNFRAVAVRRAASA